MPLASNEMVKPLVPLLKSKHEERAKRNHGGLSLEKLAATTNLTYRECYEIIRDRPWSFEFSDAEVIEFVLAYAKEIRKAYNLVN